MKNSQKGFAIPLIITIIAVLAVGGGVYFYTKNKSSPTTASSSSVPNDFITYNSPIGFSISYPSYWTTKEAKGVDTSFGGVQLLSPGTSIKYNSYNKGDTLEQLISVGAGVALEPLSFQQIKASYKSSFEKQYPSVSRKIVDQKNIKIDGTDAYEIVYTENNTSDNTSFEKIIIVLLADPTGLKNDKIGQLGTFIEINYMARLDAFDRILAEKIILTFKEHILQTYEKKSGESRQNQPQQTGADIKVRATLANLRATAEIIYDKNHSSYESICSSGVLNTSADSNIQSAVNEITSALKVSNQVDASLKCFSSKQKYALSSQTAESKIWCIDNTGTFKSGVADKVSISCK